MLTTRRAAVTAIAGADSGCITFTALVQGENHPRSCVAYPALTGGVNVGDTVVLNTTATALGLGTGGVDFLISNDSRQDSRETRGGSDGGEHIVKLRYTPLQHAVRAAEMDPTFAEIWENATSLEGTPVVVCGLHSQIGPVCAGVKAALPSARVVYVMTDSAALPIAFSRLVGELKAAGLIDATITAGQAFGGDWECVADASALIAARHIAGADVIVVAPGPGNAGTGTRFGFSSVEQGMQLTLAALLDGAPVAVLRLSLADRRARHHGLSHHSVTAIGRLTAEPCAVAVPLPPDTVDSAVYAALWSSIQASQIGARHRIVVADGAPGLRLLTEREVAVRSMGRGVDEDPMFFHAAAAAGAVAVEIGPG